MYLSILLDLLSGNAEAEYHFRAFGSQVAKKLDFLKEVDFAKHPPLDFRPIFAGTVDTGPETSTKRRGAR